MKKDGKQINVLMVGVGKKRVGGMWTVAEQYINSQEFNSRVNLIYIPTSTNGSIYFRSFYMLIGYIRILFILSLKKTDIVHIHMAEKGSTFRKGRVARWSKKRNKKVIIHLHAGPFMAWYNTVSNERQEKIRKIFGYADQVLVLGEYWKKELVKIIPENKMMVLYNGVICPDVNQYNMNAKDIVYFGVMRKEKGTYDLIRAIAKINNQMPKDMKVVLCGNDLEGTVPETVEKEGLKDRIELPGWVTGNKKEEIYRNAMIDVLPSYYEGLSMTVLEAMARGIPIITTNISTMPELLDDVNLFTPGDIDALSSSILRLINCEDERRKSSESEYDRARKCFSVDRFIMNTLRIYSNLMVEEGQINEKTT